MVPYITFCTPSTFFSDTQILTMSTPFLSLFFSMQIFSDKWLEAALSV